MRCSPTAAAPRRSRLLQAKARRGARCRFRAHRAACTTPAGAATCARCARNSTCARATASRSSGWIAMPCANVTARMPTARSSATSPRAWTLSHGLSPAGSDWTKRGAGVFDRTTIASIETSSRGVTLRTPRRLRGPRRARRARGRLRSPAMAATARGAQPQQLCLRHRPDRRRRARRACATRCCGKPRGPTCTCAAPTTAACWSAARTMRSTSPRAAMHGSRRRPARC